MIGMNDEGGSRSVVVCVCVCVCVCYILFIQLAIPRHWLFLSVALIILICAHVCVADGCIGVKVRLKL